LIVFIVPVALRQWTVSESGAESPYSFWSAIFFNLIW